MPTRSIPPDYLARADVAFGAGNPARVALLARDADDRPHRPGARGLRRFRSALLIGFFRSQPYGGDDAHRYRTAALRAAGGGRRAAVLPTNAHMF